MKISLKAITLITLAMAVMISSSFSYSYGQTIQDLTCSGCIQIENSERLEIHKFLELPIILWAEDFTYNYDQGSKIIINGHSNLNDPNTPIVFTVTNPIGNLVTIDQIMVKPGSDFKVEFNSSGPLWKSSGMYIIKAQAGPQSTIFKTNVNLISMDSQSSLECNSNEITVSGTNGGQYCIPYESSFALSQVTGSLNTETKTLTLNINGNNAQTLSLDIDRKLLNAKSSDGADAEFIVMVNGEPADFTESDSSVAGSRTITVSYGAGGTTIEIIGTSVIPEFGSIAVIILVVAIISIVVLTHRKIPLMNNFSKF
jgi:predicted secreted protein with PEFG-CTERM motif